MANRKETPDVSLASEKSKAKQQRLALIAGLTITFGIVLIIVLIFMQKSQIEENNVVTTMSIDKLQENVDTLDSSTSELRTQLEGMLEQLNSMDSVIQTNKATVESINTTATGSGENIARAEKDILALQSTLSEYIKQFESETTNTNTEIKEQFNTVNSDVEKLLQEIDNNNDSQTTNYKELSSQMDKTLKDMNSFIEKLSKENDTQYKELTKQTEEFETKLNEYLETFNSELNATLKEDIDGVNTHLDTVQSDIATTKQEITNLLNEINAGQTKDMQTKFDAIQKHLNDMTAHYDKVLADITDLINKLSAQNKKEFEDTINKLTSVQTDLTTLNNDIASDMNTTLSNMQADYTKQITDLQTNVNNSFENVNEQITANNSNLNNKLDSNNQTLNNKIDNQTTSITEQISNVKEELKTDNSNLESEIKELRKEVTDSFTSVSNGKKKLVATLLTYDIKVNKAASIESFDEINEAIKYLGDEKVAGDTIIQESIDTVSPEKILAGQSVIINNEEINGTATSDADATADNIMSGHTAYVNGEKISGNIPNYGNKSVVLTSNNKTQTLPAGYYEGISITSDATTLKNATITYTLTHVHTGNSKNGGGCYTIKKGSSGTCSHPLTGASRIGGTGGDCPVCHSWHSNDAARITYGGGSSGDGGIVIEHTHGWSQTYTHSWNTVYYELGCGHEEGEVMREPQTNENSVFDLSEITPNEKLSKITVEY